MERRVKGRSGSRGAEERSHEPLWLRVEQAHRQIRAIVAQELAEGGSLGRTRTLFETFPKLLREHFADEERPDGLFDSLRAVSPSVDSKLKFLQRDHREILETVEAVRRQLEQMDRIQDPEARRDPLARIQEQAGALMRRVRRHEEAESRLIVEIDYSEEGGSG